MGRQTALLSSLKNFKPWRSRDVITKSKFVQALKNKLMFYECLLGV